ncbi:ABC transporter substrate-binding protein [Paenarthrobacter nitroguajacolicus]|uniref:ABC transporter substrate-binding protein n=1 Tax=Paenarthrobacter nitroguajacolicus TaxID=211146 RepID=UPI00341785D2
MATDPTYPPYEYFDTDNKTIIGWDVDMGNALASSLGLTPQYVPASFDTILPGLASNKYDAGMSAFNVTEERQKVVDFVPYISGGSGMAVLPGNPSKLSMTAATLCGKKIAAQKGTHEALDILPAMSEECTGKGEPPIDQAVFPAQTDANLALLSGRVDGVMADSIPLAYQGKLAGDKFELADGGDYEPRLSGIALNKESGLRPAITAAMKAILQSDTYSNINKRWGIPSASSITADQVSE